MSTPARRPMPSRPPASTTPTVAPRAGRTPPPTRTPRRLPPALNTSTWLGALVAMVAVAAVLWIVEAVNVANDYDLNRFGLQPRKTDGLWGIIATPFLHANAAHMLSNTLPVIFVGWVLLLAGWRTWSVVTLLVVVVGDGLAWLVGPSHTVIVGASGMVFGWLGYLIARAIFSREWKWIFVGIAVLFFFGTLLFGLFPSLHSNVSWQAHVCGFGAGIATGALLHPGKGRTRFLGRPVVS